MSDIVIFALIGIGLMAAAIWLLRPPSQFRAALSPRTGGERAASALDILAANHCRYFPQLRQAFSNHDDAYLRGKASPAALRAWRKARRRAMRNFLAGLYNDFAQLNRTARAVARMAPHLDRLREAELFWLGLRFRLVYRVAVMELTLGVRPAQQVLQLAEMIGGLGSALERLTSALAENSGSSGLTS